MNKLDEIMDVWCGLEDQDPDISTEKLIALTMDMTPCTHDELMDSLQRQKDGVELFIPKHEGEDNV